MSARWRPACGFALAAVVALGTGGGAGCARAPPQVGEPAPRAEQGSAERDYQRLLEASSSRGELYDGFDTRLFAAATYQSAPFRAARVERSAAFQVTPEAETQALLAHEQAEHARFHDVFLGVYAGNPRHEDFDRKDSIWRLALVHGDREVTPLEVQRLGRATLDRRAIYPYLGDFWIAYRLRFPRTAADGQVLVGEGGALTLRLASSLGKLELPFRAD